ncbi:PQQ-dependent sugar dehydrogenase [Thaumasiovibrio subtropicus]|uniref:PQQ-dependent sugar dehydrogenase n=1 Tax=Thaumasiovibrio subtropicus TaxID=1891207 RepID=UPI000B35E224|nr:PQQ-dependent sugar dehydrogenase [Thaumasiovibrio subtropicus]
MRTLSTAAITLTLSLTSYSSHALDVEPVASGLVVPWGMAFIDAHQLLVTERNGTVKWLNIARNQQQSLTKPDDVAASGQGGLLDIAIDPNATNTVYLTYSKQTSKGAVTALATSQLQQGSLSPWQDILVSVSATGTSRHYGSRITFDGEGSVYLSIGDRGERDNGQDLSTHAGAILRLNKDGSAVESNPFNKQENALPEIFSYGHRNPQGLYFDNHTQSLWSIEHGPRGGDEINLIEQGQNYGWATVSHGKEYWGPISVGEAKSLPGMEDPKLVYIPSIAPSGLVLYRGERYPSLDGKLLAGALKLTHINVVGIHNGELKEEARLFEDLGERIRDIEVSPDGLIYFSTDSGTIYRIKPEL